MNKSNDYNFKFNNIDNKFRWENNDFCIEYSNPSIQGFSEFLPIESLNGIFHYYYDFKIFEKNKKEKLLCKIETYDFPNIDGLNAILVSLLNDNNISSFQKNENISKLTGKHVEYEKRVSSSGFGNDDFYELTKIINQDKSYESYNLYCGTNTRIESIGLNTKGIRLSLLKRKDIEELKKCVTAFLEYSIKEHNLSLISIKNEYKIINNKIYEYGLKNYREKSKKILQNIYIKEDNIDLTIINKKTEIEYLDIKIINIKNKNITVLDGNKEIIINIKNIADIFYNPTKEDLHLSKKGIAMNFLSILNNNEKKDFKELETKEILKKYAEPIKNRIWIYRNEHGFDFNDYCKNKQASKVVLDIVNIIKKNI